MEEENEILFDAVAKGDKELVKFLLQEKNQKINLKFENKFGMTALHKAVDRNDEQIVTILVEHGSNIDIQDKLGNSPLHITAHNGFGTIAKFLLEHGSNIHLQDRRGWTPLHRAAYNGHEEIVKILLESGSNEDLQDQDGKTALEFAADQKIVELITQFKRARISNQLNEKNETQLLRVQHLFFNQRQ